MLHVERSIWKEGRRKKEEGRRKKSITPYRLNVPRLWLSIMAILGVATVLLSVVNGQVTKTGNP